MSTKYTVFRVRCEEKQKCQKGTERKPSVGTAFLYDNNTLITCRHVAAMDGEKDEYSINVLLNDKEEQIKSHIVGWDAEEDEFKKSTIVVLKTEQELLRKEERPRGVTNAAPPPVMVCGFIEGNVIANSIAVKTPVEVQNAVDAEKGIQCSDTGEWVNRQIDVENSSIYRYEGLSGSPIYNTSGNLCGIFVSHDAYGDKGPSVFGYGYCDNAFHDSKDKALEMAKRKEKEEAERKASQPIRTFAEYVAEACHDRPMGLRILANPSEYTEKYPGQNIKKDKNRLNAFMDYIQLASISGTDECAEMARKDAFSKLKEIYGDKKHLQDVYVSALFGVFERANRNIASAPRNMEKAKRLFDISAQCYPGEEKDERHFHAYRRLLLAECNVALGKYEDARTELVEVRRLCDPNTNCYAYSNILEAYCLLSNDDAENYDKVVERLELALQNCPDCRHYLTHTAVLRKLSEYYARAEKYESALKRVTEAYLDDTREGGTEGGIEKDRDCFFKICVEAWNHYVKKGFNSYKNWHEFYTKEVVEGPMYRVFGDVLEESIRQKWLGVLNKWNCNGRNCSEEVLKSTDVLEYAYSADKIDTKNFETLLQENVHKALFIKVTDCLRMSAEEFKEKCKKFDLWLSSKLGLKGNDGYYPLDGDARLYIYEYKNEEGEILPVWHLICMK